MVKLDIEGNAPSLCLSRSLSHNKIPSKTQPWAFKLDKLSLSLLTVANDKQKHTGMQGREVKERNVC